jgi:hypothetical protein
MVQKVNLITRFNSWYSAIINQCKVFKIFLYFYFTLLFVSPIPKISYCMCLPCNLVVHLLNVCYWFVYMYITFI